MEWVKGEMMFLALGKKRMVCVVSRVLSRIWKGVKVTCHVWWVQVHTKNNSDVQVKNTKAIEKKSQ